MDTLHTVMRSIRGETKSRRDHLSVFRQFLDQLERISRQRPPRPRGQPGRVKGDGRARRAGK